MIRSILVVLAAIATLNGCASEPKDGKKSKILENRLSCTVGAPKELHVLSKWWKIIFASEISEIDAETVCQDSPTKGEKK